jgi:hypothetical protein
MLTLSEGKKRGRPTKSLDDYIDKYAWLAKASSKVPRHDNDGNVIRQLDFAIC